MKKKLKGEYYIMFLAMAVPIFILMMVIVYDFGNFLIMRSTVRSYADSAAIAAAGSVDMGGTPDTGTYKGYGYVLNQNWAEARSWGIINDSLASNPTSVIKNRMTFVVNSINVDGEEASVTMQGTYRPVWTFLTGGGNMVTSATAKAKAATGIIGEVP